jgi:CHRD domain
MYRVVHRRALAVATLAALLVGLLVVALPGMASATSSPATFIAVMQGGNEVPGPGDPDAFGVAFVRFDGTQTCFTLTWHNLDAPTRAHIHQGARGVAGPIVLPFFEGAVPAPIASAHGCVTGGADLINDIRAHPDQFYVNIHTAALPAGAMRGQLHPFPIVPRFPSQLEASLSGANEVPPADPDGTGTAKVTAAGSLVCWQVSWANIGTPTRGHIHQAPAGVNGPIVVPFFEAPGGLPSTLDSVDGCTAGVDQALVRAIHTGPSGFYVNLHNAEFPGGAIRGQLHR